MTKIVGMTNCDPGFYILMGPVFGSRDIERQIKDRIYDDADKTWYLLTEKKRVLALVSLVGTKVKNLYGQNQDQISQLLQELPDGVSGIVPAMYRSGYEQTGFTVKSHSENFVKIGGKSYE